MKCHEMSWIMVRIRYPTLWIINYHKQCCKHCKPNPKPVPSPQGLFSALPQPSSELLIAGRRSDRQLHVVRLGLLRKPPSPVPIGIPFLRMEKWWKGFTIKHTQTTNYKCIALMRQLGSRVLPSFRALWHTTKAPWKLWDLWLGLPGTGSLKNTQFLSCKLGKQVEKTLDTEWTVHLVHLRSSQNLES